jgi:hypothetical protein
VGRKETAERKHLHGPSSDREHLRVCCASTTTMATRSSRTLISALSVLSLVLTLRKK